MVNRILLIFGIIVVIGGGIQLFGLDQLDVCDDDDLIENLTESKWKTEGGMNLLIFNEEGTFSLTTDGGANNIEGTYTLLDDCNLIFPNAKSGSEYDGVMSRHVRLSVANSGNVEIDFANNRYNSFTLKDVGTCLKESDFPELTKR